MKRVVGYARLSTAEQATGLTLEQQIDRLRKAGAQEVLHDLLSGTRTDRPQYQELMRRAEAGEISKVIATRLDRLGRDTPENIRVLEYFGRPDTPALLLLDQNLDASTLEGLAALQLTAVVAGYEVKMIRQRAAHGKAFRKAQARADIGPWGLRLRPDGRLEPDTGEWVCTLDDHQQWSRADAARATWEAMEQHGRQYAWRWMHDRFGWGLDRTSLARWALNPAMRGARGYGVGPRGRCSWAQEIEGADYSFLIEPDRHRRFVEAWWNSRPGGRTHARTRKFALSGLVSCAHCGRRMRRRNSPRMVRWECRSQECPAYEPKRYQNSCLESELMEAVCDKLAQEADRLYRVLEVGSAAKEQRELVSKLSARRAAYAAQLEDAPELAAAIEQLDQQIAEARQQVVTGELSPTFRGLYQHLIAIAKLWPKFGLRLQAKTEGGRLLESVFLLGKEDWLTPEDAPEGMAVLGMFVTRILVERKAVKAIELQL
ncbi:MAG: recombinase family protein [Synechococcaceae cyanobacterium]|nr:recombinase family protein [Synechococcaceae cyanobacterium]